MRAERWWYADLAWATALTAGALGPQLVHRGYALRGDMVFVPDQPWKPAWLGLDGGVPRAVPMDAMVWLASQVLPGDVVQKSLLSASLIVAGLGMAVLLRGLPFAARATGIAVVIWNPWVYERLAIGQWACIAGYGILPWVVLAARRLRDGEPRGGSAVALALAVAAVCAPSTSLVAVVVALAVVLGRPALRSAVSTFATGLLATACWTVPAILGAGIRPAATPFTDFSGHAESSLGASASLATLGGIWKAGAVPPERTSGAVVGLALVMTAVALAGLRRLPTAVDQRLVVSLAVVGALVLALAVTMTVGPVAAAADDLAHRVPAVGIMRDTHRHLAPLALLIAVGLASQVVRLLRRLDRATVVTVATVAALIPLALLPSLAGGLRGGLTPVAYPPSWTDVAKHLRAGQAHSTGATVVLPWAGSYRRFAWNHDRAVLDPAPRLLPGEVLVDDRVFLGDRVLAGEDPYLRRVGRALTTSDPSTRLRDLGVRWVLVEHDHGVSRAATPPGRVMVDGRWLTLIDLGPAAPSPRRRVPWAPVLLADLAGLALAAGALVRLLRSAGRPADRRGPTRTAVVNWRDLGHRNAGGAERYAWEFGRALRDAGHEVEFLTARDRGQTRRELRDGIRIVRVGGRVTFLPRALLHLARKRRHLDLVVDADCGLPAFSPLVLSRRRTAVVLVVHHVHHTQFGGLPQPLSALARGLERRAMPLVYRGTTTVAVSASTCTEMRAQLGWAGPVTVIPNGTDASPDLLGEDRGERVVLLGRLSRHKRVDLAIRAVAALRRPGLAVDVVGDGPERARLRGLVQELDAADLVRFHGRVDESEKHRLLAGARLHLCASEAEGWGQVVLEAASHGVPTLAREVPGLRDSVRPGRTGWLVSDGADAAATVAALAEALNAALDEVAAPGRRAEIASDCLAWSARFTWPEMHRLAVSLSAEALARRRGPGLQRARAEKPSTG